MSEITILGTTDIHGYLSRSIDEESGIFSLPTVKNQFEGPILIDNGDFFVGSPEATFFNTTLEKSPMIDLANQLKFDVMVPGNHDFDYGIEFLKKQVEDFDGRYVCANLLDHCNELVFDPYTIIERQGIRVGIIGIITSAMPQIIDYEKIKELKFLDVLDTLAHWVPIVRQEADLLIVSYHGGIERDMITGKPTQYDTGEDQAYRIVKEINGVDGLICGHQHRTNQGILANTVFVQPGYRANYIGKLAFSFEKKQLVKKSAELISTEKIVPTEKIDFSQREYEQWLEEPLDWKEWTTFLQQKTGTCFSSIERQGETIHDFLTSFKPPYPIVTYHLSYEETKIEHFKQPIQGIEWTNDQLFPYQKSYRIVSNTERFPSYRLETNYVINIFDEYLAYIKKNN